jgi:pimeloyl-ACP methyl ester carboxylesterase
MMRLVLLFVLLLLADVLPAQGQTTRCYLPGREDRVTCLQLTVPLDWRAPRAEKISIFAAVIPALSRSDSNDPIFLLPGGPGQGGDALLDMLPTAFRVINQQRDVVLIYPRGTQRSTLLDCDTPERLTTTHAQMRALVQRCAQSLRQNPRFFSAAEIVRDIDAVRRSLRYRRINIWGSGHGARLAQHHARLFPATTRSLILDSAKPVTESVFLSSPMAMDAALRSISVACQKDKSCAAQMPDVHSSVRALIARLSARPQLIAVTNPATLKPEKQLLEARALALAIRMALSMPQYRATMPPMIKAVLADNYQPLAAFVSRAGRKGEAMSLAAQLSILCGEDVAGLNRTQMQRASQGTSLGLLQYDYIQMQCALWPHRPLSGLPTTSQAVAVPTLILSGGLDPVTPPALAAKTARLFKPSRLIVIPASGISSSNFACAPAVMTDFLDHLDPTKVDSRCLLHAQPPAPLSSANG